MSAVLNVTLSTVMVETLCGQAMCGEVFCGRRKPSAMASDQLTTVLTPMNSLQAIVRAAEGLTATITQGPMLTTNCPDYEGPYEIRPAVHAQEFQTKELRMKQNLLVQEIPYLEVSNTSGGTTATIG